MKPEQGPVELLDDETARRLPSSTDMSLVRVRVAPQWVGLIDFDGMRRLPAAIAG